MVVPRLQEAAGPANFDGTIRSMPLYRSAGCTDGAVAPRAEVAAELGRIAAAGIISMGSINFRINLSTKQFIPLIMYAADLVDAP